MVEPVVAASLERFAFGHCGYDHCQDGAASRRSSKWAEYEIRTNLGRGCDLMTDRMTERFDAPGAPITSQTEVPVYGTTDLNAPASNASATEHAGAVAQDAKESTKNVASTAASEAKDVAHEAKTQLRQLFTQLSGEATDQASGQTQRAVEGLRSLGSELSGMAQSQQGESGMAADLARQGASRLDAAANWLEGRQPVEILDEVRSFARRRPGAFIAGAAILGLVGGRMTRGLTGDSSSDSSSSAQSNGGAATYGNTGGQVGVMPASGSGVPVGTGAAYGTDTAYVVEPVEPVDLSDTDPTRVDAGIDPATYTHPGSSTGVSGESR
jgi:hypothetical protein